MSARISIIAAVGKITRVMGRDNDLVWRISDDLKRFKTITSGHPIIMGRKTFESIGRPLPHRTNIVITRDPNLTIDGCDMVHSLEEAITLAQSIDQDEIFIIGGAQIYQLALPIADRLYLTEVDDINTTGDTYFPDYTAFSKAISREDMQHEGLSYSFLVLEKS